MKDEYQVNLKSSLDRFIVLDTRKYENQPIDLKSSLDRFIAISVMIMFY